jgi:hypothetical protein
MCRRNHQTVGYNPVDYFDGCGPLHLIFGLTPT